MRALAVGMLFIPSIAAVSSAFGRPKRPPDSPNTISAPHGVAARTIDHSLVTVNNGMSPDQVRRIQAARSDKRLAELARQRGLTQGILRAFFVIVGEKNVPPEQYETKLIEFAQRYADLQRSVVTVPATSPRIATLKAETEAALNAGQLNKADGLLGQIATLQDEALNSQLADRSATATSRAKLAMSQLRFRDAAQHFAEAGRFAPDEQSRISALENEAEAYSKQSSEFGDEEALSTTISRYRAFLSEFTQQRAPYDWATVQRNLAFALMFFKDPVTHKVDIDGALAAASAALLEFTREHKLQDWAKTQMTLGVGYANLGDEETRTANLNKAIAAFNAALTELPRDKFPRDWAVTQMNLGHALWNIGERESGTVSLNKAMVALTAAISEFNRDRNGYSIQWAATQNNIGGVWITLAERGRGTDNLEKAVATYTATLSEVTRQRAPNVWAGTQLNLGGALTILGERKSGTAELDRAAAAFTAALSEFTREQAPFAAEAQIARGYAQCIAAERREDVAALVAIESSVKAARAEAASNADDELVSRGDQVLSMIADTRRKLKR